MARAKPPPSIPTMLRYDIHAKNDSLYNTPPAFAIYTTNLVLRWLRDNGGLAAMAGHNETKAALVYGAIDANDEFYQGHAEATSRSLMNITFRLPTEELEKKFLDQAKDAGFRWSARTPLDWRRTRLDLQRHATRRRAGLG